jgi:hypothetical protein
MRTMGVVLSRTSSAFDARSSRKNGGYRVGGIPRGDYRVGAWDTAWGIPRGEYSVGAWGIPRGDYRVEVWGIPRGDYRVEVWGISRGKYCEGCTYFFPL